MKKYNVMMLFKGCISCEVDATSEKQAKDWMLGNYIGDLRALHIADNEVDFVVEEVSWRKHEDLAATLHAYGEPNYEYDNQPIWILKEDKGLILTYGELVGFIVQHEDKIFDIWHEGHFVDYGKDYYNAYFNYISEKELLK